MTDKLNKLGLSWAKHSTDWVKFNHKGLNSLRKTIDFWGQSMTQNFINVKSNWQTSWSSFVFLSSIFVVDLVWFSLSVSLFGTYLKCRSFKRYIFLNFVLLNTYCMIFIQIFGCTTKCVYLLCLGGSRLNKSWNLLCSVRTGGFVSLWFTYSLTGSHLIDFKA